MATHADPSPRQAEPYRLPALLQDIRLLDLLELSGSTVQASELLSLSQPTVSRRYRSLAQDFGLERDPRQRKLCRYGSTEAIRLLRMGCRVHRLAAGYARIGADLIHQPLLAGMDGLLPTPPYFRTAESWLGLILQGVIDGAVISGLELKCLGPQRDCGITFHPLGRLSYLLASNESVQVLSEDRLPTVLVPRLGAAPGLRRALMARGMSLKPMSGKYLLPEQWVERLERGHYAMVTTTAHGAVECWASGLVPIEFANPLSEVVWLLLPPRADSSTLLQQLVVQLRAHAVFAGSARPLDQLLDEKICM